MITDKDREEARVIFESWSDDGLAGIAKCVSRIRSETAEQAVKDYQDVIDDYRRLTKELDIALNGDCAAKQASLCDIVAQIRSLGTISEIITRSAEQTRKEVVCKIQSLDCVNDNSSEIRRQDAVNAILYDSTADHSKFIDKQEAIIKEMRKCLSDIKYTPWLELRESTQGDMNNLLENTKDYAG